MAASKFEDFTAIMRDAKMLGDAILTELSCNDIPLALLYANSALLMQIHSMRAASNFGNNYFRIVPFNLTSTAIKILEKDMVRKLPRKVSIVVDSAVGGGAPAIRVGAGSVSSTANGFRITAGALTELGEVAPSEELFAASSVNIGAYIIERA